MLSRLTSFAKQLRALRGWRRYGAAFGFGALAGLAFPPFNAIPALWLSFPAFVFLLQGTSKLRRAFAVGWSFSFGLLVVSLYWIAGALFVDIAEFWWAVPLSVAGLPAVFAVYYGLAALAARRWGLERLNGILFLALAWFLADYARGHLMTGFPWDIMGYVWGDVLPVLQITSAIGMYGLTLLTLVLAFLPAAAIEKNPGAKTALASAVVLFALIGAWGSERLSHAPERTVPDVRLRLVQPDVNQANKWRTDKREEQFKALLKDSFTKSSRPVTHIVWPETATGFYLAEDDARRKDIAQRMTKGMRLITGVVYRGVNPNRTLSYFNSLIAIDDKGDITAGYDKFHLVPFGEYIPFRNILPIRAVAVLSDFTAGDGLRTLRVAGLPPFSPLICYEAIFPGDVVAANDPPQFLLNVTNDAWYEHTTGPAQHFAITRARAVEEGMPLIRVANKGTTAVVDSYGRIVAKADDGRPGFVDSDLPSSLKSPTLYRRFNDQSVWFLFVAFFLMAGLLRWRARKQ